MTDTLLYLGGIVDFKLNAYGRSEMYLRQLSRTEFESRHADINFYLGEIMFSTGRYAEASNFYKSYLPNLDASSKEFEMVESRINQVAWAKENHNNKDPLIKIKRIETGVNTPENESSPFVNGDTLYYSGLRKKDVKKSKSALDFSPYIFKVNEKDGQPLRIEDGLIDEKMSASGPCFSNDHTRFVYSICIPEEQSTKLHCKVYYKSLVNGKWSKGKSLPEQVNQAGYSSTHANIIEEDGIYRIYYSSNRPNGMGGFDIWTVLLNEDGSCSSPENLNYINTIGDEYSPFYSSKSKSLFFSSNNHLGFGGFDIYKYSWKGKDSLKVINLGKSVNSSYDEICYFTKNDETVSYLASDRPGSTYLDESLQACCYDIYKINSTPRSVDLFVTIKDGYDSLDLQGARVNLIDITEGDTLIQFSELSDKSVHMFKLIEDRKYKIIAQKSNYLGDSVLVSTVDLYNFEPIRKKIFLTQKKELQISTFERTTNFSLKGVAISLWDVDRQVLVDQKTNNDTNQFVFNILQGRNYQVIASKHKYESDTINLTAASASKENPVVRKMFLELSAIAELRRLLPIRLFFDNDLPNPRSELDTTDILFSKIYNDYVAKKGLYMYQFANVLKGAARNKAMIEIDTFFDKNVKFNGDKFLIFLDKLSIIMEEGHSIDIFLKGY
ncbi:MAG: hypothetical protein ABIO44_04355, partial [Saprospiraceae bacterium]